MQNGVFQESEHLLESVLPVVSLLGQGGGEVFPVSAQHRVHLGHRFFPDLALHHHLRHELIHPGVYLLEQVLLVLPPGCLFLGQFLSGLVDHAVDVPALVSPLSGRAVVQLELQLLEDLLSLLFCLVLDPDQLSPLLFLVPGHVMHHLLLSVSVAAVEAVERLVALLYLVLLGEYLLF